jgi:hypothetical protein
MASGKLGKWSTAMSFAFSMGVGEDVALLGLLDLPPLNLIKDAGVAGANDAGDIGTGEIATG